MGTVVDAVVAGTQTGTAPIPQIRSNRRTWIILSLLTLYIIWGTTYLVIRFAEESFPPYMMMGIRFVVAGGGLFIFLRLRGVPMPTRAQWRAAGIVGGLLLVGGMGTVALAEQQVSSGLTAAMAATAPVWAMFFGMIWKHRPSRIEWLGVGLGFAGVVLISMEGSLKAYPQGIALLLFATACWGLGSVWSRHLEMAPGSMGNATEMLIGGVGLLLISVLRHEQIIGTPTPNSILAILYLIVFGSLATMTAYMFLLKTVRSSLATSYAFVNPAIALFLGVLVGGEHITGSALIALPVILLGIGFVAMASNKPKADA